MSTVVDNLSLGATLCALHSAPLGFPTLAFNYYYHREPLQQPQQPQKPQQTHLTATFSLGNGRNRL